MERTHGLSMIGSLLLRQFSTPKLRRMPTNTLLLLVLLVWLQTYTVVGWTIQPGRRLGPRTNNAKLNFVRETRIEIENRRDVKLLLLDHYDSFTYNLVDLLAQFCQQPPVVLAADSDEIPNLRQFDGFVLSPGPGHPSNDICSLAKSLVANYPDTPILGVCLGHQILGQVYGAKVDLAPAPIHGQVQSIRLLQENSKNDPIWADIPNEMEATRYHSLHVTNVDVTPLVPTALSCDDDLIMAMRHDKFPHFGVQFHPESIGTNETGKQLLRNFVDLCQTKKKSRDKTTKYCNSVNAAPKNCTIRQQGENVPCQPPRVMIHKVENLPPGANMQPEDVMKEFLANETYAFWLDESQSDGAAPAISILGASDERVEYWGREKPNESQGVFVWSKGNEKEHHDTDILSYLQQVYRHPVEESTIVSIGDGGTVLCQNKSEDELALPFGFRGGHVGYLGYEVRFDTMRFLEEEESGSSDSTGKGEPSHIRSDPTVPTSAFLFADKSFVYDHQESQWYLVGVLQAGGNKDSLLQWFRSVSSRLGHGRRHGNVLAPSTMRLDRPKPSSTAFVPKRSRSAYNRNFDACMDHIKQGDSYELCLTNQLDAKVPRRKPLDLYTALRRYNPAPFSAFLTWNANECVAGDNASLAICCSSPERFVSVKRTDGIMQAEAKPIKGTIARITPSEGRTSLTDSERELDAVRARNLQESIKDRAENLMIVDLLRNDLSRVCKTGTIHVSDLMDIESFATVHQMVSTIRGEVDRSSIDILKACFPGGSMTGAPKRKTMQLLTELEEDVARGPYSGCLGYLSLNGCMDMNIVIRTAILTPSLDEWNVCIGAGGAITTLSQSTDEYGELMLKASAVMKAVETWSLSEARDDSGIVSEIFNSTEVTI